MRVQRGDGEGAAAPGGGRGGVRRAEGVAARPVQQLQVAEETRRAEHLADFKSEDKSETVGSEGGGDDLRQWEGRLLTGAVSVGGRRSAVARTGEEGGQAGQVRVLTGEEGLPIVAGGQQAGLRGETDQVV